jgi:hypothetical protein
MPPLSISQAWEETKELLARDGRLLGTVGLALFVLPLAVMGAFVPGGVGTATMSAVEGSSALLILLVAMVLLVILVGQLAITRLAIGPSTTVGGAISQAARKLASYFATGLIVGAALMIVLFIGALLVAATVELPATEEQMAQSPGVVLAVVLMFAVYLFLVTRIISIAAAVAVSEAAGPIGIIRRAWALTSGHFWRLFGFILLFMVVTGVAILALSSVVGTGLELFVGAIEPISASALILAIVDGLANGAMMLIFALMLARIYVQLSGGGAVQPSVPRSGI